MGVIIYRPGQRLIIPNVRVLQTSAAGQWWLSGGVSAANCVAAYRPKGAANLADSYINLANPGTFNAAPGVAPTWDATNGWIGNGTTQYLTTGITPASGWSAIVRFTGVANGGRLIGENNVNRFDIRPSNAATNVLYGNGAGSSTAGAVITSGVLAIAGNKAYRNAVDEGLTLTAWSGTTADIIYIFALNQGGAVSLLSGNIQAIAIYNTTLNSTQVAALTTAINLI